MNSVIDLGQAYLDAGLVLVPISAGSKGPRLRRWNIRNNAIYSSDRLADLDGIGLAHAWSRTCALDVDDMGKARVWLASRGVDLDALIDAPDAVAIESGRAGRTKLIYRVPQLLNTKLPRGSGLELRCATANGLTVQDALPPTVHPDTGKPYTWRGDWHHLPAMPPELEQAWRALLGNGSQQSGPKHRAGIPNEIPSGERNNTLFSIATGIRRKGTLKAEGLNRLKRLNRERCKPPLSESEVLQLVDSAWSAPPVGFTALPNELLDSDAVRSLSSDALKMLLYAYRKSMSGRLQFELTNVECIQCLFAKKRVQKARKELMRAGVLEQIREPISGKKGVPRQSARYKLPVIWVRNDPNTETTLGVKTAPPIKIAMAGAERQAA